MESIVGAGTDFVSEEPLELVVGFGEDLLEVFLEGPASSSLEIFRKSGRVESFAGAMVSGFRQEGRLKDKSLVAVRVPWTAIGLELPMVRIADRCTVTFLFGSWDGGEVVRDSGSRESA